MNIVVSSLKLWVGGKGKIIGGINSDNKPYTCSNNFFWLTLESGPAVWGTYFRDEFHVETRVGLIFGRVFCAVKLLRNIIFLS